MLLLDFAFASKIPHEMLSNAILPFRVVIPIVPLPWLSGSDLPGTSSVLAEASWQTGTVDYPNKSG